MGSLVLDLQADALDPKTDTSDLLRKAKVIATKLDIPDLGKWTDLELNGYPDANNVPEYRMIRGELRAFNPYNRIWCEFVWGPKGIPHALLRRPVTQSVSSLGQVLNDKSDALTFSLPSQLRQWVMDNSDSPLPPTFFISAAAVKGIVDVVRNSVLEWALRME